MSDTEYEEEDDHGGHFTTPAKLVTFGSLVHLNLDDNFSLYIYGEGFIDQRLKMKKFDSMNSHESQPTTSVHHNISAQTQTGGAANQSESQKTEDFTNCLFMILPFGHQSQFQYQKEFIQKLRTKKHEITTTDQKISERKSEIIQTKNKIEMELQFNTTTLQRSTGQKILLYNSNFMLMHMNTMKYVSLNMENQENIFVELVNEPNDFCFFKFMPCLQLQKMRNDNFVYEEELFYIVCSQQICGKHPYLIADAKDQLQDARGRTMENYLQGSIDVQKSWKLNLYQEPNLEPENAESHSYLKCGDILWLILSEKNFYLSASRICDPFEEVIKKENRLKEDEQNKKYQEKKKAKHGRNDSQQSEIKINELQQMKKQIQANLGMTKDRLSAQLVNSYERELLENFQPEFEGVPSTSQNSNKMMLMFEMTSNGLYKIEPQDQFVGGHLEWRKPYRIRHVISGKYLSVKLKPPINSTLQLRQQMHRRSIISGMYSSKQNILKEEEKNRGYQVELIDLKDQNNEYCLWTFIPIDNLMEKFQSKTKIHQDSYFRLENHKTKYQLGFDEESLEDKCTEDNLQKPIMYKFQKDVNTFRFRKASFQDQWEINFLTSTIPVFIDIFRYIVYADKDENQIKSDQKYFPSFDQKYQIVLNTINNLKDFLNNNIISNIALNQEYNFPSENRQKKFRKQTLLGMMLWSLTKLFPNTKEWKKVGIIPNDDIATFELYGQVRDTAAAKAMRQKQNNDHKNKDKILKTVEGHIKKRYALCYKIYELLQIACYRNPKNQKYFAMYLPYLTDQIGLGEFVSVGFQASLQDNFNILSSLHRISFQQEEMDLGQEGNLFGHGDDHLDNFFKYIVKKLKKHDAYSKDDLLDILGKFCLFDNDQTIYINQEKIYSSLVENRTIIFTSLLKVICEGNHIYVEVRERENYEFKFNRYKLEDFQRKKPEMIEYLMAQIIMYSSMCSNRNYTCGRAFGDMFPQKILKQYLRKSRLNEELKSVICKLLLNIYIDKEPRLIIQKPNLVRIFKLPKQKKVPINKLFEKTQNAIKNSEAYKEGKKLKDAAKDKLEQLEDFIEGESSSEDDDKKEKKKKDDIYVNFIKQNSRGSEEDLSDIKKIIEKMTFSAYEALKNELSQEKEKESVPKGGVQVKYQQEYTQESDFKTVYEQIYNSLNYEIIKMFHIMLKFGMFTSHIDQESVNLMETIIGYLSFILEYDSVYFQEISQHVPALNRKYIENSEAVKKRNQEGALGSISIGGLTQIGFLKKKNDEDESGDVYKNKKANKSTENATFLQTYHSLFKLLSKFTNKTYTAKEVKIQVQKEIEIQIKLEICKIFDYLLDWREEYQIDKMMNYFKEGFYATYAQRDQELEKADLTSEFLDLLPAQMVGVGEEVDFSKKKKNGLFNTKISYDVPCQVRNIDEILDRPFTEILLIAFYFSPDADLSNAIMNLVTRCYTQKQKLFKNLDKINLVAAGESDQSYKVMSKLISRLKALHSYAQSWLQIIEQNNYNEKAEENLDVTKEQLKLLELIFYDQEIDLDNQDLPLEDPESEENQQTEPGMQNRDQLYIKQKIFKHLAGFKFILTFLQQGSAILEVNYKYFKKNEQECKFSYKFSFVKKVIETFTICHKILCNFCQFNNKTQKTMFKYYKRLLINMNLVNLGQIDFILKIFQGNSLLVNKMPNQEYLEYMINMIKLHGHHPEFLQLFKLFIDQAQPDTLNIQKLVLDLLLDPDNIKFLNPFKDEKSDFFTEELKSLPFFGEDQENNQQTYLKYQELFIQIITHALRADIGVNYVVKAYKAIPVKYLITMLAQESENYRDSLKQHLLQKLQPHSKNISREEINSNNFRNRRSICELLMIYFARLDKSIDDFQDNADYFIECINVEFQILQTRCKENKLFESQYSDYILEKLVPIINVYADNFLKDDVLLAIISVEEEEKYEMSRKVQEFGNLLIQNLNLYICLESYSNLGKYILNKLENVAKLAATFKIRIQDQYVILKQLVEDIHTKALDLDQIQQEEYHFGSKKSIDQHNQPVFNISEYHTNLIEQGQIKIHKLKQAIKVTTAFAAGRKSQAKNQINQQKKPETDHQKYFQKFKDMFTKNKAVKEESKMEARRFVYSILDMEKFIANPKDARDRELLLSKEDMIKKFLSFIEYWQEKKATKSSVIFILKILRHIVVRGVVPVEGEEEQNKTDEDRQNELRGRQNLMDSLNTTKITLKLFWNNIQDDNNYKYYLLNLLISLLDGGNHNIQLSVYYTFLENQESEKFFAQLTDIIQEEVQIVKNSKGMETSIGSGGSGKKPVIESALRLLQLFCEGHYTEMQDYMRSQSNSKVNYDMITIMINLLVSFKISNITQSAVQQCLDTLTEIVQGPCKLNQQKIVHSKFLEFAVDILREEEKIFHTEKVLVIEEEKKKEETPKEKKKRLKEEAKAKKEKEKEQAKKLKESQKNKNQIAPQTPIIKTSGKNIDQTPKNTSQSFLNQDAQQQQLIQDGEEQQNSINLEEMDEQQKHEREIEQNLMDKHQQSQQASQQQQNKNQKYITKIMVHRGYIARIKYKCLITLLSLLELSEDDPGIVNRIRRTIPLSVLTNNITDLYGIYKKQYKGKYLVSAFARFDQPVNDKVESTPMDEMIIEIGFFLYILMVVLLETSNKSQLDLEQNETWEQIKDFTTIEEKGSESLFEQSILGKLLHASISLMTSSYQAAKQAAEKAKELTLSDEEKEAILKKQKEEEIRQRTQLKWEAIEFFAKNTAHIEIARNDILSRVHFPLLPFCRLLPDDYKENFHDNCDIGNSKTKLSFLMSETDQLIKVMSHQEHLQELYKKIPFLGFIASNKVLWEQLVFYTNWAINFIILLSYSQKNLDPEDGENESKIEEERLQNPKLFWDEKNDYTKTLINSLGIADLILSSIVIFLFFLQKAPLLLQDMWIEWWQTKRTKFKKFMYLIFIFFKSIYTCFLDFEFMYQCCYMALVVLGLVIHPFIYGILTLDMLRSRTLRSVVQAIYYPREVMGLTFLLFLLITYWFSLLAYIIYQDHFETGVCDSLSICFLRVFDYMFKEGGGVGSFMADPKLSEYEDADLEIWVMQPKYTTDADGNITITEVINYNYLGRFFFDFIVLFILVILVINMVAGIIIDTFKALKEEQQKKEEILNDFCFICNIEREKLDKAYDVPNGFYQHIKADHYLWNYVFFKAYIEFKDKTEYTGNETYVVEQIKTLDVSWFPIKQAIAVVDDEEQEGKEKSEMIKKIEKKMEDLRETVMSLNVKSRNILDQI